jgi:hypothetical protein
MRPPGTYYEALKVLQAATAPMTIAEIAKACGVEPNIISNIVCVMRNRGVPGFIRTGRSGTGKSGGGYMYQIKKQDDQKYEGGISYDMQLSKPISSLVFTGWTRRAT